MSYDTPDAISSTQPKDIAANTKLITRAIKEGWPIDDHVKEVIVKRMSQKIEQKRGAKFEHQVMAAKVLIQADSLNVRERIAEANRTIAQEVREYQQINIDMRQQDEDAATSAEVAEVKTHIEDIRDALDEMRRNSSYVHAERQRAIESRPHAGLNGRNGHARTLDAGPPPGTD